MTQAERYDQAIQSFIDKVRGDPNVIAVIVCGSVVHGTVWEKSDIDMTVVVRDQKLTNTSYGIYEDNILINVDLCQRSDLKRTMEKNLSGGFAHSFGATSKIMYTTDDSLYEYLEDYKRVGEADMEKTIFQNTCWLLGLMEKVEKWLATIKDPVYAHYYLLKAADALANIEVCSKGQVPTREAILQADKLNPELIERFYYKPMSGPMTTQEIKTLLKEMESYILTHMDAVLNVASEFFGDGEIKTGTQIARYFNLPIHALHPILDFLCDQGYLEKISQTIRLTPKGRLGVEEVAFIMIQN